MEGWSKPVSAAASISRDTVFALLAAAKATWCARLCTEAPICMPSKCMKDKVASRVPYQAEPQNVEWRRGRDVISGAFQEEK